MIVMLLLQSQYCFHYLSATIILAATDNILYHCHRQAREAEAVLERVINYQVSTRFFLGGTTRDERRSSLSVNFNFTVNFTVNFNFLVHSFKNTLRVEGIVEDTSSSVHRIYVIIRCRTLSSSLSLWISLFYSLSSSNCSSKMLLEIFLSFFHHLICFTSFFLSFFGSKGFRVVD